MTCQKGSSSPLVTSFLRRTTDPHAPGRQWWAQLVEAARICIGVNFPNLAFASLARSMEAFTREYTTIVITLPQRTQSQLNRGLLELI